MNLRISVEAIVMRNNHGAKEILLVKRSPTCKVAPNVWNVPAGKVNLLETTSSAVLRETLEETGLKGNIVRLLVENAFEVKVGSEVAARNMFTYLLELPHDTVDVVINHEHTEFSWVTEKSMQDVRFSSLSSRLRESILMAFSY